MSLVRLLKNYYLTKKFIFFGIFLINTIVSIFPNPIFYGWDTYGNQSSFYLKGKKLFQGNELILPAEINKEDLFDLSYFVGEYYISKLDKENFFKLIGLIQQHEKNSFLESFLISLWYWENAQEKEAEKKLNSFINYVNDIYEKTLAEKSLLFLSRSQNKKIALTYDDLKNLSCSRSKNYYNLCRVLKIRILLEIMQKNLSSTPTEYANLDRLLAPFFEEEELSYIPFLDRLIPDLPPKLIALGLAREAVHFQKILLTNESILGKFDATSFEKLASYQIYAGKFEEAERSLETALKNLRSITVMKNNLLLKLGALNYIKKDYSKALNYLLQLNFKHWGRTLKNPITDEPISINSARELIALTLSKAKSGAVAVKALNKLKKSFPTEEGLFIRLRIAQILFRDKPQLAEKMTEEIIYIAQSKGWKRVEYAATLLNGFTNIINKKHRKAVIQFTKSFGILGNSDPNFTSEWIRQSGMIHARIAGKERGNHSSTLKKLLLQIQTNYLNTDFFEFKLYLDPRFGIEEFNKFAINYFITTKEYDSLLELLYSSKLNTSNPFYEMGNLQVPKVHYLIKNYNGFKASIDNVYYKSFYGKYREQHVGYLRKLNSDFNISLVKNASIPVLFLEKHGDKVYSIGYNTESNEKNKWTVYSFSIKDYQTAAYYNKLISLYPFLVRDMSYQIYFNELGLDLYQILNRQRVSGFGYLFFGLQKNSSSEKAEIVHLECNPSINNSSPISVEQFEGSRTSQFSAITQVWNFYEVSNNPSNPQETYQWKCKNGETLEFRKLQRRMDSMTLPNSLFLSNPLLHNTNPYFSSGELFYFLDFWFRKGVNQIVYSSKIENDPPAELTLKLISTPNTIPDEWKKVQLLWKNSENEGMILWREPK